MPAACCTTQFKSIRHCLSRCAQRVLQVAGVRSRDLTSRLSLERKGMRADSAAARCMSAKSRCMVADTPGCRTFTATTVPASTLLRAAPRAVSRALCIWTGGGCTCEPTRESGTALLCYCRLARLRRWCSKAGRCSVQAAECCASRRFGTCLLLFRWHAAASSCRAHLSDAARGDRIPVELVEDLVQRLPERGLELPPANDTPQHHPCCTDR